MSGITIVNLPPPKTLPPGGLLPNPKLPPMVVIPPGGVFPNPKADWIKSTTENCQSIILANKVSTPSNESSCPLYTIQAIITYGLSLIPGYGGIASAVAGVTVGFINDNASAVENGYKAMMKEVAGDAIIMNDIEGLKAKYKSYLDLHKYYIDALKAYTSHGDVGNYKSEVVSKWNSLEAFLTVFIHDASVVGKEVQELQMYTIFTTCFLLILREKYIQGKKWGFDDEQRGAVLDQIKKLQSTSLLYCQTTYRKGMDMIPRNRRQVDQQFGGEVGFYNDLNTYRNAMILNVFDVANYWEYMIPDEYPNYAMVENVRYLFSDIAGVPINKNVADLDSMAYYQNRYIDLANLMELHQAYQGKLNMVKIKSGPLYPFKYKGGPRIMNIYNNYVDGGGQLIEKTFGAPVRDDMVTEVTTTFSSTPNVVKLGYDVTTKEVHIGSDTSKVIEIDFTTSVPIKKESDYYYQVVTRSPFVLGANIPRAFDTVDLKDHKISQVFSLGINQSIIPELKDGGIVDSVVVGFLPVNVFPNNILHHLANTIVNPQKYLSYTGTLLVFKDKLTIGKHVVNLTAGSSVTYRLEPYYLGSKMTLKYQVILKCLAINPNGYKIDFTYNNKTKTSESKVGMKIPAKIYLALDFVVETDVAMEKNHFTLATTNNIFLIDLIFVPIA
ncbi:hypothetical protein SAMD00019534_096070 [Acytostelium subglobosum LB1]|uniref:hypothetical protein n=1 Tax=Acytostelium subglobosum LB1 TaxID=1410327 RepID=UPI000644D15F|nr:hypothetical protein SAMD00019534_096070 [Acytostelium subglobosum LB1]GAM26432.1 hypothetical protein SAMD00019534_096070 [Acytostelium subglobosum LB1]|eukprot:XP_012750528.1 hypothetical protein SAMD00019534_096070 [Acytostelium subglobosum LB1]